MNLVSFVILHYGDEKVTDTCVNSILQLKQQDRIRLVVVDNEINQTKDRREFIKKRYEKSGKTHVLTVKENGGFSYGNNLGYQYARQEQKANHILILNNDIEFPQEDFVKRLDSSYEKYHAHILGPDVIRASTHEHQNPLDIRLRTKEEANRTIRMNRLGVKFYSILFPILYLQIKKSEKQQTKERCENLKFYGSVQENIVPFGACFIFTKQFVEKEDLAFSPETRFYYEEYILAKRCEKNGYKIVYDPSMMVLHESGAATKNGFHNEKKRWKFVMERTAQACEVYLNM